MHRLLYLIFFILVANLCYGSAKQTVAAKPVVSKVVLKMDTSTVSLRHLDSAALKAYSKLPEFQYKETIEGPSLWTRFWRWFWHLFNFKKLSNGHVGAFWAGFLKYTFIVIGMAALVFLIFKLTGVDMANIFRKKSAGQSIPYSEFFEDINRIDFDQEIENAVSKNNYRFAVRLLYLKCLKQLSDAGMIDWQIDKTNSTYISELINDDQRSAFKQLTRQFEYVWYGEFLIDGPVYKNINLSFNDFNKRVS